jgi:hypothetical protein
MKMTYTLSEIPGFINIIKTNNDTDNKEYCDDKEKSKYYNVTEYSTKSNEVYKIVRYKKEMLALDLIPSYGLLRSVIINSENRIVSFSPPKSLPADQFMTKYSKKSNFIIAQEFVEGTMINVFFDTAINSWKIATRNTVDANVSFYRSNNISQKTPSKTFNTMFVEACQASNLNLETLSKTFCYSFVLQHPDNRIVVPFTIPRLYLVEVFEIIQTETDVEVISQNISAVRTNGAWNMTSIRFPEVYEFTSYSELIEKFASANTPYDVMGIVIKNMTTNERTKIRNPIYEEVRHLKGNQSKLQYQYLHLRKEGKIPDFLKFYPENKKDFSECRNQVHMFTLMLHQNYLSCYVKKERPLGEYGQQFRTHMFKIHEQYINDLKPRGLFVNNTVVINYVNNLAPALLMHSLNFHLRKQKVDIIKADDQEQY